MSGTFHKPKEGNHLKINSYIHNYYMLRERCLTNEGGATRQTEPNA